MRVLFDIVHPAHVHFYRHVRAELERAGHETLVVARDKEVTLGLLDAYGIPYQWTGHSGHKSAGSQAVELVERDLRLVRVARQFGPDIVCTRNPAGVHAGRIHGAVTVFDTVDGRSAGAHFRLGAPLADVVTSPSWLDEDYGLRHLRYRGPKELAYLHPSRFRPDPGIRDELGLGPGAPLVVVRLVAHYAAHDTHTVGLGEEHGRRLVARLARSATVIVSTEGAPPPDLEPYRFRLGPERIHDLLATADLFVGDSGSMAAEAAVLGTPALRLSSWDGPVLGYLGAMEQTYGLVRCFRPEQAPDFDAAVERAMADLGPRKRAAAAAAARLVGDADDVTSWQLALLHALGTVRRPRRWRRLGSREVRAADPGDRLSRPAPRTRFGTTAAPVPGAPRLPRR